MTRLLTIWNSCIGKKKSRGRRLRERSKLPCSRSSLMKVKYSILVSRRREEEDQGWRKT